MFFSFHFRVLQTADKKYPLHSYKGLKDVRIINTFLQKNLIAVVFIYIAHLQFNRTNLDQIPS